MAALITFLVTSWLNWSRHLHARSFFRDLIWNDTGYARACTFVRVLKSMRCEHRTVSALVWLKYVLFLLYKKRNRIHLDTITHHLLKVVLCLMRHKHNFKNILISLYIKKWLIHQLIHHARNLVPVSWHFILPVRFSYQGLLRMRTSILHPFSHAEQQYLMYLHYFKGRFRVGVGVDINKIQSNR